MPRQVMKRSASDNEYFHPDFHGALSAGIEYLDRRYGAEAVRQYLRQFALAFYAPLTRDLKERGLIALKQHFEKVYEREGGTIRTTLSNDELVIEIEACPAVSHMRERGYHVARLFHETTRTVNEALCEGTLFRAELAQYDDQTGRAVVRFCKFSVSGRGKGKKP